MCVTNFRFLLSAFCFSSHSVPVGYAERLKNIPQTGLRALNLNSHYRLADETFFVTAQQCDRQGRAPDGENHED